MPAALLPILRRLWRVPAVCAWIAGGLLLALGVTLAEHVSRTSLSGQRQRLCAWWMRALLPLLPLRIRCHGQISPDTRLLLSNHVSWLDIVVIGAHAPTHFLSKAEVRDWPLIGWLANAAGTVFIRRGQVGEALQTHLANALRQGNSLAIFAEGTTTPGDQLRTFHGRLLGCAIDTATPIQPVAIAYHRNGITDRTAPFINNDEFTTHLFRLLGSAPIDVELHFLAELPTRHGQRTALARQAQRAVGQALGLAVPDKPAAPGTSRMAA